jgi:SPP1 gp7 family putative phage head morphogenesis protein
MSVLDEHLKRHRKKVIARETATIRELLTAYDAVERELRRQIAVLEKKIRDAIAAGEKISPAWYMKERRLATLIDQVKNEIERFGRTAARLTTREQAAAIRSEASQMAETMQIVTGTRTNPVPLGGMLTPQAVADAIGMMGDGSPILEYYAKNLAPAVVEMIRKQVIEAAATGTPFRTIANRLIKTGQITRSRALMVARTEVGRVRRETDRLQLAERPDIFSGWEWAASKSVRTCAVCLALDGRIFKLDEVFPQHPNCRCTMIPVMPDVPRGARTLGSDWFDTLDDDEKAEILGKEAADEYKRGTVDLRDFVGWRNSKEFGKSVYKKSLAAVLMAK